MKKQFLIKLVAMAASLVLAMMVSHFLIYKGLIVPRLPNLSRVPFSWWLGAFAPEFLIFIVFGFGLRWRELLVFSATAALVQQIFRSILVSWEEPGYLKGDEGAIFSWTIGLVVVSLMSAILFSLGMLVAKAAHRKIQVA